MSYRTIVADPPWQYEDFASLWPSGKKRADRELPYAGMSIDAIKRLPIADLAYPDGAALFLWTTNRYAREGWDVLQAWGFEYRQVLVWHKTNPSPWTGSVAPISVELLLVGIRNGGPGWLSKHGSAVVKTRRLSHSEKPEAFLDMVEQVSPGPYLEMFARRNRLGWDTWGNEALEHVEMAA